MLIKFTRLGTVPAPMAPRISPWFYSKTPCLNRISKTNRTPKTQQSIVYIVSFLLVPPN